MHQNNFKKMGKLSVQHLKITNML